MNYIIIPNKPHAHVCHQFCFPLSDILNCAWERRKMLIIDNYLIIYSSSPSFLCVCMDVVSHNIEFMLHYMLFYLSSSFFLCFLKDNILILFSLPSRHVASRLINIMTKFQLSHETTFSIYQRANFLLLYMLEHRCYIDVYILLSFTIGSCCPMMQRRNFSSVFVNIGAKIRRL